MWLISLLARVKIVLAWLDDWTGKPRTLTRGVEVCELDGMAERLLLGLPELMRWGLCLQGVGAQGREAVRLLAVDLAICGVGLSGQRANAHRGASLSSPTVGSSLARWCP